MSIKTIFQDGVQEVKRQAALRTERKNLSQKEELRATQWAQLGKKAWENHLSIDSFGDSRDLLTANQSKLDELKTNLDSLETETNDLENKKKEENNTFDGKRKVEEDQKKEVDNRWDEQKKKLKEFQRDMSDAEDRLKQIAKEQEKLNNKSYDPETTPEQKAAISSQLDTLANEKLTMIKKRDDADASITKQNEVIRPIAEESAQFQRKIDQIKTEQKQVIGQLDESLSKLKKDITEIKNAQTAALKEQNQYFESLGKQISESESQTSDESISEELSAVSNTNNEIETITANITTLESQASDSPKSALWKMIGIILAVLLVLGAIIAGLIWLFTPKEKSSISLPVPGTSESSQSSSETSSQPSTSDQAAETSDGKVDLSKLPFIGSQNNQESIETQTGKLKDQSEKMLGKKIIVSDKKTLLTILPSYSGWKLENVTYNKNGFSQMETSVLEVDYVGAENQRIHLKITDSGTVAIFLAPLKVLLTQTAHYQEDDNGYEKFSTYNNVAMIEKYTKNPPFTSVKFILKDRYMVEVNCRHQNSQALLKEFLTGMDMSKLQ